MTDELETDVLSGKHDRSAFDCGNDLLNHWLQRYAGQFFKRDLAVTYAMTKAGDARVIGYFAISCHSAIIEQIPTEQAKELPNRVGARAIEVDAIDDQAREFYLAHNFTSFLDNPNHLFFPMKAIRLQFPRKSE